jgi:hypothetical protein
MNSSAFVITYPDDLLIDATRLLLVDLDSSQTQLVSDALKQIDYQGSVILYYCNSTENTDWLLDKKHKSDIIFFNADSTNDLMIGYLSAQPNSYYFGTLRLLLKVAGPAIYTLEECTNILLTSVEENETK